MTVEMLEKANEIQNELTKLRKECKRIPRQYLDCGYLIAHNESIKECGLEDFGLKCGKDEK